MILAEAMEFVGVTAGTGAASILATLAVLRWRADRNDKKDEQQDADAKATAAETARAIGKLHGTIHAMSAEVKAEIRDSEQRTDAKLNDLTRTISRKIEGIRDTQAGHGERLASLEAVR